MPPEGLVDEAGTVVEVGTVVEGAEPDVVLGEEGVVVDRVGVVVGGGKSGGSGIFPTRQGPLQSGASTWGLPGLPMTVAS